MTRDQLRNRPVSTFVAEAIAHEMEADERVVVLGEDVGRMGGVFGATRGLQKRFGPWRVRDTPIAEMSFTSLTDSGAGERLLLPGEPGSDQFAAAAHVFLHRLLGDLTGTQLNCAEDDLALAKVLL